MGLKYLLTLITGILLLGTTSVAEAQDARVLIKEGLQLHSSRDYTGAIEKFRGALSLEPDNPSANYLLAFTLNSAGKGTEAIPHLQQVVASNASPAVVSSAYGLLGTIYDQSAQPKKAIENYQAGIKIDSANQLLRYSLGLAWFRGRQYAEAEKSAISAIKLNPKHAGSMRLYALVTFHQDKRAAALLGLCSYLWLEPNGASSAEAYGNLQSILAGGALKPEPGKATPTISAETRELNRAITAAVADAARKKYATPGDKLADQLKIIFTNIGKLAENQKSNSPLFMVLAARYFKLAQTENMPAFARHISQKADKNSGIWLKAHPQQNSDLESWFNKEGPWSSSTGQ